MTCRELADFIADYLDGTLAPMTSAEFARHLSLCPNCQKYLAGYKAAIALSRDALRDLDAELPDDVPEDLVRAILAARRAL